MVIDEEFDLNILRGWQKSQLELLKTFAINPIVPQTMISGASGSPVSSNQLGGKITPLVRHDLIVKAYKDTDGRNVWQLNEDRVERETLLDFISKLGL